MSEHPDEPESPHYSDTSFWEKVTKYAKVAGEEVFKHGFTLYYCLQDDRTPTWAKTTIVGALGYLILPVDAIPDIIPVVGFSDDLGALAAASATVAAHIIPEHKVKAADQVETLFGKKKERD
ncbi:MAG: uncharacterized membrane protein YkvA (DUF1232 family) [Verrucomicrobiales bacterium]|jgi:uncharacterized membrane protein YkvA (DUF1232 family)